MRKQLEAVLSELTRMKSEGIESVYMEDSTMKSLQALRPKSEQAPQPQRALSPAPRVSQAQTAPSPRPENPADSPLKSYINTESKVKVISTKATTQNKAPNKASTKGIPDWIKPVPAPTAFDLPDGDKQTQWDWLRDRVLNDSVCHEHVRLEKGKKMVFGVGDINAKLFFCGDAPGEDEEKQGEPFVSKAGQLLDKIIGATGLSRQQVYMSNIMNWRPEHATPWGNRPPTETELTYCLPYLEAQVGIVKPEVIIALGVTTANGLLGYDANRTVGRTRGRWRDYRGVPLLITYHPSYLLRNSSKSAKRMVWEDILLAMEKIKLPISEQQREYFL